ncbi:hypothetical protein [Desulfoferula mesophila]|uniref:Uncharacterized protein n=1 Tax=Desulfoferula mesophila TaxID=3058419 RepID=A0AAU9EHT0_9BACT|nr:hypothetical protein FAK_30930 [Desulfoferula mesophilus]
MSKPAKQAHEENILEYLTNPDNEWPTRQDLATKVLGISQGMLYQHFTGAELDQLEAEALNLRRSQIARYSVKVDRALYDKAVEGDVSAMKLWYQRMEGMGQDAPPTGKLVICWEEPEALPVQEPKLIPEHGEHG